MILAGLLLGGALAHFFGGANGTPKAAPSELTLQTMPSPSPPGIGPSPSSEPTAAPSPTLRPTPSPKTSPSPSPLPSPSALASPSTKPAVAVKVTPSLLPPTPVPAPKATPLVSERTAAPLLPPTPEPSPKPTPKPVPATAAPARVPAAQEHATSIVRSYLEALARGDRATARSYMASGETPSEDFMNPGSQIASMRSQDAGDGRYKVTVDVRNGSDEYYDTFELEPGPAGLQITGSFAIKPQ
ncbi:MAG TPA: hypothetical protein VGX91_01765 [Candidatus Cybelea sp.]|nr:hypothetical protein [Candidatus Cybelea sp.]